MGESKITTFDNLSEMQEGLKKIELAHSLGDQPGLQQARNGLIRPGLEYQRNRFEFGRALCHYAACLKAERAWMEASQVIADAVGVCQRTIFRMVQDYERAQGLAPAYATALAEQRIDPAARKNESIVRQLMQTPAPLTSGETRAQVKAAVEEQRARKIDAKTSSRRKPRNPVAEPMSAFIARIVQEITNRFHGVPSRERTEQILEVLRSLLVALNIPVEKLVELPAPRSVTASRLPIPA